MKNGKVELRRLRDKTDDYKMLEKWYKEEAVYSNFEQRILGFDEIVSKYKPRTKKNSEIPVYIIKYNGIPVGIIQYQRLNNNNLKLYKIIDNDTYEVDIFIGNVIYQRRGIGTIAVDIISKYLFSNINAKNIVMCPLISNVGAIKCYEKCGFIKKDIFITEDTIGNKQNYCLMIKTK